MANWGMMKNPHCANGALLVIIEDYAKVHLGAMSCEFVCRDRPGGLTILNAMQVAVNQGDILKAVMNGIDAFERVLHDTIPESLEQKPIREQNPKLTSGVLA